VPWLPAADLDRVVLQCAIPNSILRKTNGAKM